MSPLKQCVRTDLSEAIKARDELRTATLRMALTAITSAEVAGANARELTDDDVVAVLAREAKKRREAAEAFAQGGRDELAARERAEGEVLAAYLPTPLSDPELADLVRTAISETGAEGSKAIGMVMKTVTPRVAGRAEGGRVAAEVRHQLSRSA